MQEAKITKDDVLAAMEGAATMTEVARKLGLLKGILSGHMAKMIRSACPEINDILKANKASKASTETATKSAKVSPDAPPDADNPYRPGSTYAVLFQEGSKRFMAKGDLIERVAAMTRKSPKCIGFSLSVLCHKSHSSNCGRSTVLYDESRNLMKLIALKRKPTGAC